MNQLNYHTNHPLYRLFPELALKKGLFFYLDVAKHHFWFDGDSPKSAFQKLVELKSFYHAILLGGSDNVTKESISFFSEKLESLGYDFNRTGLVVPSHELVVPEARFAVLGKMPASDNPYFAQQLVQRGLEQCGKRFNRRKNMQIDIAAVSTFYVLASPAEQSTCARVTNSRVITKKEELEPLIAQANSDCFKTFSLDAGSGAPYPISEEMIRYVRERFKGLITVGGGISTGEQVRSILSAGADIVIVGDILEKLSSSLDDLERKIRELWNGRTQAV